MPVPKLPPLRSSMVMPWQSTKYWDVWNQTFKETSVFFRIKTNTPWFHWWLTKFYKEPNHCGVGVVCSGQDLSQQTHFRGKKWNIFFRCPGQLFIVCVSAVPIINALTMYTIHHGVQNSLCSWRLRVAWMKPSKHSGNQLQGTLRQGGCALSWRMHLKRSVSSSLRVSKVQDLRNGFHWDSLAKQCFKIYL